MNSIGLALGFLDLINIPPVPGMDQNAILGLAILGMCILGTGE